MTGQAQLNQGITSITQEEAQALENIMQAGYEVEFALLKEEAIGNWKKFRGQFGFNQEVKSEK